MAKKSLDFALTLTEAVRILPVGAAFGRVRFADVAQLAEQLFCKQQVAGSSPIVGSALKTRQMSERNGQLPEWTIGADCKSAA